jgi:general secretion pathway protein G
MSIRVSGRRESGFTLIEMLLVVVIIGILAGAIVTSLSGRTEQSRVTRAKSDLTGSLATALELFNQDTGRYPTTEEGLKALIESPNEPEWKGPYLQTGLKADPWGQQYSYELSNTTPPRYVIRSAGPDRQLNTEDDILP